MSKFKTIVMLLGLGTGFAIGCGESLDDLLLNAVCDTDGECGPSQQCYRTPYQTEAAAQGFCRESNTCEPGLQPGCGCEQFDGINWSCDVGRRTSNEENCRCVPSCTVVDMEETCTGNTTVRHFDGSCQCVSLCNPQAPECPPEMAPVIYDAECLCI